MRILHLLTHHVSRITLSITHQPPIGPLAYPRRCKPPTHPSAPTALDATQADGDERTYKLPNQRHGKGSLTNKYVAANLAGTMLPRPDLAWTITFNSPEP